MSRAHGAWPAMLLLGALASPAAAAAAEAASGADAAAPLPAFQPPLDQVMLLSRTLWRSLADGHQIVATRRYRVRFVPQEAGWRVDGELVASEIDAPERLRPFAELERARPDDGLFPLVLDQDGRIASQATGVRGQGRDSVEKAIALAAASLGGTPRPEGDEAAVRGFLQQVQALASAAVTTHWPPGLFRPDSGEQREERRFALPDGREGLLTIQIAMARAPDRAVMASCERRVVTEIAGDRRLTREHWTLEPFAAVASR